MKTVFLHGLGQTTHDWKDIIDKTSLSDTDCPDLFSLQEGSISYSGILTELEKRYANMTEPFRICGLSLGALLSLDYTIRHGDKVDSLILMGVQYRVPTLLIDFQNLIFRCMPKKTFENMGIKKNDFINLTNSMADLDIKSKVDNIKCKALILCGEKDNVNMESAKQLNRNIKASKLEIIKNAGHEVNTENPKELARVISKYWK